MLYGLIPTMPDDKFEPLMARDAEFLNVEKSFTGLFGIV